MPGSRLIAPPASSDRWVIGAAVWALDRPWLLAMAIAVFAGYVARRVLVERQRHRRHATGARLVTIAPPPVVDRVGGAALWANLSGVLTPSRWRRLWFGTPHVVWQYAWTGRRLQISIWVPGTVAAGAVEAAVRAAWPGAATTTGPVDAPIPEAVASAVGGHLLPTEAEWLPVRTDHDTDPLRALVAAGSQLKPDEYAVVQVLARPAGPRRLRWARRAAGRLRTGGTAIPNPGKPLHAAIDLFLPGPARRSNGSIPVSRRDPGVERDVRAIVDKTAQPLWQTGIRYAVAKNGGRGASPAEGRVRNVAAAIAGSYAVYDGRNRLGCRANMSHPVAVLADRRLGAGFLTNTTELPRSPRFQPTSLYRGWTGPGPSRCRCRSPYPPAGAA
jgi:hypothetical protein